MTKPHYARQATRSDIEKKPNWHSDCMTEAKAKGCTVFRVSSEGDLYLFEGWKKADDGKLPDPEFFVTKEKSK